MKSLKLVTDDRAGLVADITKSFAEHRINIEDMDAKTFENQAVIELIVDKPQEALAVLRNKGLKAVPNDLIAIRIVDEPGSSAKIMNELSNAKLSIRGITTLHRKDGYCYVALSTDNDDVARKLLHEVLL
jgi:hypothetical protein